VKKTIGKVHERLEKLLTHDDCPRLVHWDIWATNILAKPDEHGKWWITGVLDPNCKYAHAEAEIAYMDLFHTITPPSSAPTSNPANSPPTTTPSASTSTSSTS